MRTVRVIYHEEPAGWWAASLDVPGWSAAAGDLSQLRDRVAEGLEFFLSTEIRMEEFFPSRAPQTQSVVATGRGQGVVRADRPYTGGTAVPPLVQGLLAWDRNPIAA